MDSRVFALDGKEVLLCWHDHAGSPAGTEGASSKEEKNAW